MAKDGDADERVERLKAKIAHAWGADELASAAKLVATMEQTAAAFEEAAALAEQEAARRASLGREEAAEEERQAAAYAREGAQRAHAYADEWRRFLREQGQSLAEPIARARPASLEELAEETETRAARVRGHAAGARLRAERYAAQGAQATADRYLREAKTHEDAAHAIDAAAAFFRQRVRAERHEPPPPSIS